MMNKMSSITFPDGSNYEITDDKARKDITEINNKLDITNDNVSAMHNLVYSVEKIFKKNVVSFAANTSKSIHSFTATKKCELNLMIYICGENAGVSPKLIQVYAGDNVVGYTGLSSANGHIMTMTVNTILEAGQGLVVYSQFFQAGNNTVTINGYKRDLE